MNKLSIAFGAAALSVFPILIPGQALANTCGASGQKPCFLLSRAFRDIGGFCESGLDHIPLVACVPKIDEDEIGDKIVDLGKIAAEIVIAFNNRSNQVQTIVRILTSSGTDDPEALQRIIEEDERFDRVYALAKELGRNTLTVGLSLGGSFVGGIGGESGVSLDVNKQNTAYGYVADYTSIGFQLSLGLDLVVSGFLADNVCIEDGVSIGKGATFDVGPGGGLVIWHSETGDFLGFSVPVGVSSGGGGYARVRAETDVLSATCGQENTPNPVIVPAPGPTPEPVPPRRHIVMLGDSLWQIAVAT